MKSKRTSKPKEIEVSESLLKMANEIRDVKSQANKLYAQASQVQDTLLNELINQRFFSNNAVEAKFRGL